MKKIAFLILLLVCAQSSFAAEKANKYSALKSLKVAAESLPQSIRGQVVRILGEGGKLHPVVWEIVFYDPTTTVDKRVVRVSKGEVLTNKTPFDIFDSINNSTVINLHDIKLDSDKVINVVHKLCYENKLPLYIVDIQLTKLQSGNVTPVWIVTLKNARNNEFGVVTVSAKTGKILATEDVVFTADSRLRAEKSFGQSFVDTFLGIGADMEDFFTGKRTVDD